MVTIACADCGHRRRARNSNTRYCHKCRLLRNLEYLRTKQRSCKQCSSAFAPVDVNDAYCGEHALGYSTLRGLCRFCGTEDAYLIKPDVPACISCARDPAMRRRLIQGLQNGQRDRIANPQPDEEAA